MGICECQYTFPAPSVACQWVGKVEPNFQIHNALEEHTYNQVLFVVIPELHLWNNSHLKLYHLAVSNHWKKAAKSVARARQEMARWLTLANHKSYLGLFPTTTHNNEVH